MARPKATNKDGDTSRPAKRPRTAKASKEGTAKKPKIFKDSFKSAERVVDSDDDSPVKPAPRTLPKVVQKAKARAKARSESISSASVRNKPRQKASKRALSSEDDDFPAQARSRKSSIALSRTSFSDSDSEDAFEAAKPPKPAPRVLRVASDDHLPGSREKKPKHRVYQPADLNRFRPKFVSQAPPESSDPSNLRGEIWIKPPTPVRPPPPPAPSISRLPVARPQPVLATVPPTTIQSETPSFTGGIANAGTPKPPPNIALPSITNAAPAKQNATNTVNYDSLRRNTHEMPFVVDDDEDEMAAMLLAEISSPEFASKPLVHKPQPTSTSLIAKGKENVPSALQLLGKKPGPAPSDSLSRLQTTRLPPSNMPPPALRHGSGPGIASILSSKPPAKSPEVAALNELADLPSDAFSSSEDDEPQQAPKPRQQLTRVPSVGGPGGTSMRQTTLFGSFTGPPQQDDEQRPPKNAWPLADREQKPTHHQLNSDNTRTWVYPINLGTIREYQYNIVNTGLFHNLLVALPTGLGKTFIAATVMLNWFRWTKDAQIVFVAPTKPLVAQQVDACFHTVGIPRSETAMLTGQISPALRAEAWAQKRVFFTTPQTMQNDLKRGIADPKRLVLLVVDEAHRATGNYAYVDIVRFVRRFNSDFRVLALTATPGAKIETVQQVIDSLNISRCEIRTEASMDIRQYVHSREIETEIFDYSDEQELVMELFSKAIKPVLDKLNSQNACWMKDPMRLTAFGLTQAQRQWNGSEAGRRAPQPVKVMVMTSFRVLSSLAHSVSFLKFHGITPFFRKVASFQKEVDEGQTKFKAASQVRNNVSFSQMMNRVQGWVNNPDFIGHPKLEHLRTVIMNYFLDVQQATRAGEKPAATRVMIFAQYRDSAENIVKVLKRNEPLIKPHVFVGQAAAEGSAGMDQKTQLDVIDRFKDGTYNTLVATSIGEEGLDIGEVDLIICYDANASPIRMLQRMGRTGRKRQGKIVLLLMRDKEERDFAQAKDNYEKMQSMIASGKHFNYHEDQSLRILPRDVKPVVEKRVVEIPVENSQLELPMPTKGGRKKKLPPKKFHMPDGVVTSFVKASRVRGDGSDLEVDEEEDDADTVPKSRRVSNKINALPLPPPPPPEAEAAPLPFLTDVLLNKIQERELARKYQYVTATADDEATVVQAPMPEKNLEGFRNPGPECRIKHGRYANDISSMFGRMHDIDGVVLERLRENFHLSDLENHEVPPPAATAPAPSLSVQIVVEDDPDADLPDLPMYPPFRPPPSAPDPVALSPQPRARASRATKPRQPRAPKATASRTKAPQKPKAAKRKAQPRARRNSSDMEGGSSSPPPTPREYAMPSQAISLGTQDTSGDEDMQDPDAWLADSDLVDFVVRSDEPIAWASSSAGALTMVDRNDESDDDVDDSRMGRERERAKKRKRVIQSDSDE